MITTARLIGMISGGAWIEALNLLAGHHWIFAAAATGLGWITSRRMKGKGIA